MNTQTANYYELLKFGLGTVDFQQFIDRFQQKYNVLDTSGFVFDPEIQLDYTYEQLEASLGISTLPVYMDVDSPALDKSYGSFSIGSNKVPTQKHRYSLNTKMLRERMLMIQRFGNAALNSDTRSALIDMLYDSTDKLLQGNHNALTHQRHQVVSTGQFTISSTNNPRGITGVTFDFGIPDGNRDTLAGTSRWWTNVSHTTANEGSASDPLGYLKEKARAAKKAGCPAFHIEMSEDLFDDLLTHTKVLSKIGLSLAPTYDASTAVTYAQNLQDDAKKSAMERIVGCPIVTRDSLAAVERFNAGTHSLETTTIDNFDPKNVSLVPNGQIGTIKSVQQIVFSGDPGAQYAWFDGGRTLVSTRYDSKTREMFVESEFAMLCVPTLARYMYIWTVTV